MVYYDNIGHMISDSGLDELHEFARKLGLKREWFQDKDNGAFYYPHYDLTTVNARHRAEMAGAIKIGPKDIVRKLTAAPYQRYK
jgi:hypothetical protein